MVSMARQASGEMLAETEYRVWGMGLAMLGKEMAEVLQTGRGFFKKHPGLPHGAPARCPQSLFPVIPGKIFTKGEKFTFAWPSFGEGDISPEITEGDCLEAPDFFAEVPWPMRMSVPEGKSP